MHNQYSRKGVFNHVYLTKMINANERSPERDPQVIDAMRVKRE